MKKLVAILLTIAIMLTFTVPTMAYSLSKPELRLVDIHNYIQRNLNFLTDEQKTALMDLKEQFANWRNLTSEERLTLFAEMEELVKTIRTSVADKKGEFAEFRLRIQPVLSTIRANNAELKDLFHQNQKLRGQIRAQIEYSKTLDDYTAPEDLATDLASLKALYQTLKDTQGQIREILKANRENILNMDYEKVEEAFQSIVDIQTTRIETMTEINALLIKINESLPTVPETTPTVEPSPTV